MKAILSIAGGGMRGIGAVRILCEIERRIGRQIGDVFDFVTGTSTGGIVGCLIAAGVPMPRARGFYYESGPVIFAKSPVREIYSVHGAIHTRYPASALQRELRRCLGDKTMREGVCDLMVTSAERRRREVMVKSWKQEWQDIPLALAALMTASAPTYFPQAEFLHAGEECGYLDGGLVRNDPCACAGHEALMRWRDEEIFHVSLGTGQPREVKPFPNGGALFWAAEVFDGKTTLDSRYDTRMCEDWEELHSPRYKHERFDFTLPRMPALDDADANVLNEIQDAAWHGVLREWPRFQAVLDNLA